jgi:hypothetical protein
MDRRRCFIFFAPASQLQFARPFARLLPTPLA